MFLGWIFCWEGNDILHLESQRIHYFTVLKLPLLKDLGLHSRKTEDSMECNCMYVCNNFFLVNNRTKQKLVYSLVH